MKRKFSGYLVGVFILIVVIATFSLEAKDGDQIKVRKKQTEILYRGMENTVNISVPNYNQEEICVDFGKGCRVRRNKGYYLVIPYGPANEINVKIYSNKENKLLDQKCFKVIQIKTVSFY
jgi:hypothetical protein